MCVCIYREGEGGLWHWVYHIIGYRCGYDWICRYVDMYLYIYMLFIYIYVCVRVSVCACVCVQIDG